MHGLGNDFIVIEDLAGEIELAPEAVEWFCDRNFGIGADGLMLVRPATVDDADFSWWFRNGDGSVAEMCGNGIRCFAKYLVDHGHLPADQDRVRVQTAIGVLTVDITRAYDGTLHMATVDMGEPHVLPADIPTTLGCEAPEDPVIGCPLETELGTVNVTCVSMGNPHCVIFVDDVQQAPVAAALNCLGGREATVELPGGELAIRWREDGHVLMTGPAVEVFSGVLAIPEDDE